MRGEGLQREGEDDLLLPTWCSQLSRSVQPRLRRLDGETVQSGLAVLREASCEGEPSIACGEPSRASRVAKHTIFLSHDPETPTSAHCSLDANMTRPGLPELSSRKMEVTPSTFH